jgi:hypothetical protein
MGESERNEMTLVGYPSSDFPPPPTFSLRIPDGWQAAWPAGTLLAAHGPAGNGGVTANILVAYQRMPPGGTLDEVVARATELLQQETPARDLDPPRRIETEGTIDAVLLAGSFIHANGVRVLQRQILLQVESAGPGTAVLEVTATCVAADIEDIQAIVGSFKFAPVLSGDSLLPDANS